MRIKKNVAFRSPDGSSRLLFRILNVGKQTDELKFQFIDRPDFLIENNSIFNGDPFVCVIYLGHMKYALPPNNGTNKEVFRINNIAKNLDMALWFYKTSCSRRKKIIEGTDISTVVNGNVIEIVETNR